MNVLLCLAVILAVLVTLYPVAVAAQPVAKKIPKADTLNGDIRIDEYGWIRQKDDPAVIEYLEAENAYTDSVMKPTDDLQEILYREMLSRIKETDMEVPYLYGGYYYYTRTEEGKAYSINCRRKGGMEGEEEIILDQNAMAKDREYFRVGRMTVSPDQALLAFSVDTNGSEAFDLMIKDLRTGAILPDRIPDVVSVVWATDGKTVFYTKRDEARRPYRLFRHALGTDRSGDPLIFEEKDELYDLSVQRTKSEKYILLVSGSSTSTEYRYIPAASPEEEMKPILPREENHEYYVDHNGDFFYILSNRGARNFRLVKTPVADPSSERWIELIPHSEETTLEDMEMFRDYLVVTERRSGLQQFRIMDLKTGTFHYMEFPEPAYSAFFSTNEMFDSRTLRYRYQSFITPSSVYDYDMVSREKILLKQTEVPGGYNPDLYASERIFARASDGVSVPISIVYKKGMATDGSAPLLLYGYGSYGITIPVTFSSNRLSLLDRGFIYALAHVRGGGDVGRAWKDDGRMLRKKNTFTDFIACAEHLIAEKYTSPEKLTIEGGSAGGLLVGAVLNMRPDLFRAAVAQVPFVDVMNTMLDASLPLTVGEYLEWGNPNEKKYYDYMRSYCPYTNVSEQAYPNILVRVGLNDPRVGYWEGTKWVARLRDRKTDDNAILLKVNMGAGHSGRSGRYVRLRETAFDYAYLISQVGLSFPGPPREQDWKK